MEVLLGALLMTCNRLQDKLNVHLFYVSKQQCPRRSLVPLAVSVIGASLSEPHLVVAMAALSIWGEPERAPPGQFNGCAVYIYIKAGNRLRF